jgi:quinol monooxygenase YgiN
MALELDWLMINRYKDQDALHVHLLSPHFQEFGSKAAGLMEKPYDVKVGHGILQESVVVTRFQA